LDSDPSPNSIYSLDERIDKITPLVATDYARTGALSPRTPGDEDLIHMLGTRQFSGSGRSLLKPKRFPDLLLLWIGNNNSTGLMEHRPACESIPKIFTGTR